MSPYGFVYYAKDETSYLRSFQDLVAVICAHYPEAVTDEGKRVADMPDPCGKVYYVYETPEACAADDVDAVGFMWTSSFEED